ncbi:hypothetical protein DAPPUDRAFT_275726 [Daphnia pulex]|uniref:Uncharacterized protein n=1 Tax=Daphnia pulex TaxID=6669 RepID=E9I5I0_DAPPU|nr:hypothetical protein DAPPUDRAFT_275726 [Daphnia pulex]|eukprot:EFX60750.1 hypothetical protein DAPPUDRAFT_275726 [Daphnia pulex]
MRLVTSRSEQQERVTVPKTPSTNHESPQFPRDLSGDKSLFQLECNLLKPGYISQPG